MMLMLKNLIKRLLYTPSVARVGEGTTMLGPRWISNPQRIVIGSNCRIGRSVALNSVTPNDGAVGSVSIEIGDDVYIGGYCQIHALNNVTIADGTVLSEYVYISDVAHGLDPSAGPILDQPVTSKGPVRIGPGTFIGYGASVLPGVTLGRNCVVGTRSVVTTSFPAYSMVVGNPARLIKVYDLEEKSWVPANRASTL